MMSDWTHTAPPVGLRVLIFNHAGYVRRGISDGVYVRLTDCTHPMQNAIYPSENVIAWKVDAESEVKE